MEKYVTDIKNHIYMQEEKIKKAKIKNSNINITINLDNVITKYLGMGGAITESVAYNYSLLSKENKKNFINDCFNINGLNYQYIRICIGSCDFSLKSYSYAKNKDLRDFNINHDKLYLIPLIKDILKIKNIDIIASPWSPPTMYKNFKLLNFGMKLAKRHYNNYANYLIKYLEYFYNEGININYITMQNEPIARQKWESCKFTLDEQRKFIYEYLLPKLNNTKLLLYDHNKDDLYNKFKYLYKDNSKISGIAFHNYTGGHFQELKKIKNEYPDLLLINTEGCCGYSLYDERNWIKDAEYYINDIMGDFNNGCNAYLDWNIMLDENGGPCHVKNPVKSSLILKNDNYIKTPIYYYLFHISHFVEENMDVVECQVSNPKIKAVAFKDNKQLIIVIMNNKGGSSEYNILINNEKVYDMINAHSIITYVVNL